MAISNTGTGPPPKGAPGYLRLRLRNDRLRAAGWRTVAWQNGGGLTQDVSWPEALAPLRCGQPAPGLTRPGAARNGAGGAPPGGGGRGEGRGGARRHRGAMASARWRRTGTLGYCPERASRPAAYNTRPRPDRRCARLGAMTGAWPGTSVPWPAFCPGAGPWRLRVFRPSVVESRLCSFLPLLPKPRLPPPQAVAT